MTNESSRPAAIHSLIRHAGRPLRLIEIAVALRDKGYRADHLPHTVCTAVRTMFRRCPERFIQGEAGRWWVGSE